LWCQVDGDDLEEFRDHVLVPALARALGDPKADRTMLEDLIGLVAMVPPPTTETGGGTAVPAVAPVPTRGTGGRGALAAAKAATTPPAPPPPAPTAPAPEKAVAAWKSMMTAIDKADDKLARVFALRRATVKRERTSPPPMIKKVDFCSAAQAEGRIPNTAEP